jgi:rhomboid protease GluP
MESYKSLQLAVFLSTRFNYRLLSIDNFNTGFSRDERLFMVNKDRQDYPIIRISAYTIDQQYQEMDLINNEYAKVMNILKIKDCKTLNFSISKDETFDLSGFHCVAINSNFISDESLNTTFPGISSCIYDVETKDQFMDMRKSMNELSRLEKERNKMTFKKIFSRNAPYVTYILIGLTLLSYILVNVLPFGTFMNTLILGANYKTLTVANHEIYRVITTNFINTDIVSLILDLFVVFIFGTSMETRFGHLKFAILFLLGGIYGNLLWAIFGTNMILIQGLSTCYYALFTIYVIDMIRTRAIFNSPFMMIIIGYSAYSLIASGVYMVIKIGSIIAGLLFYYLEIYWEDKSVRYSFIASMALMVLLMVFKLFTVDTVKPRNVEVDNAYIQAVDRIGLHSYAERTSRNIEEFYGD